MKISFLTGTRADYGKLKPLINAVRLDKNFSPVILATGMHLLNKYGKTYTVPKSRSLSGGDSLYDFYLASVFGNVFGIFKTLATSISLTISVMV